MPTPPLVHPLLGLGLVVGVLGALMLGLRALKNRFGLHPELVRKLLHIAMGLMALGFPWLFHDTWPVVTLGVAAWGLMLGLRHVPWLHQRFGGVVDGVARESLGEVYFPIGVAVLFVVAQGDALSFCIPVLLLALGDAVAALIGVRYGAHRFTTSEGEKSLEGSLAFFLVAFLSVHIPLLLGSNTGRAECLAIGLILGLLLMLIEAIAWRGLDNLFIPLGGWVLLETFRDLDAPALGLRFGVTLLLVVFALSWRRHTTLDGGAVLGAALVGYVAWALGGWRWLIPPLTLFGTYALLWPRANRDGTGRTHTIHDVLRTSGVGMAWLFLARVLDRADFLLPYTIAFAAHLAIIGVIRFGARADKTVGVLLKSSVVMLLPYLLWGQAPYSPWALLLAPLGIAFGVIATRLTNSQPERPGARWLEQAGIAAGSALVLVPT